MANFLQKYRPASKDITTRRGRAQQYRGTTGMTGYGQKTGTWRPMNALAMLAPAPAAKSPSISVGGARSAAEGMGAVGRPAGPEPQAMSPAERAAFARGMVGGYPTKATLARIPAAYQAYQLGMPLSAIAMRTFMGPLNIFSSLYGGIRGAQRQAETTTRAGTYTTIDPTTGMPRQPSVVNPAQPVPVSRLGARLRSLLGLSPSLASALSADPMSDYAGFGGVGPNTSLAGTAYGQAARGTYGTPQAWGGDIDVSSDRPGGYDLGRGAGSPAGAADVDAGPQGGYGFGPGGYGFGYGEGHGGGEGGAAGSGGGLGGGVGGEGDVGSGDTGAGLGAGHGGDADSEGQF